MDLLKGPGIQNRGEIPTLGIRLVTPFRGMLKMCNELLGEIDDWVHQNDIDAGPAFMRLHFIDMEGPMDIEVGELASDTHPGDDRVRPGVFPAGRYVTLTFRDHPRQAHKSLLDWAGDVDVELDRWDEPTGDHFACRYEACLTDRRIQPRKTLWEVELAIGVAD